MKRVRSTLVAAATALVVVAAPAAAAAGPRRVGLEEIVTAGAVGALAEIRDAYGVRRSAAGVAELGTTRPVPVDGRFRAGSITKTFLAVVVLQLVAEGRLRLDDTVEHWLPGAVPEGDRYTVRHLLNHTSGLYDYLFTFRLPPDPELVINRWRTWTPAELLQRATAFPPNFEKPGTKFAYSNTNYLLLGLIVEKVTLRPYGKEIERRVIRPLELRGTSLPGSGSRIFGPHPHGYVPTGPGNPPPLIDFTEMNPTVMGAGGSLISTTSDLNRFFRALLGGRLLPAHLLKAMKTPGVEGGRYGLGLAWRTTTCGTRVYGNDGDALAYQAYSFSTEDGRRQATVALTPNFRGDVDDAVDAFLNRALC